MGFCNWMEKLYLALHSPEKLPVQYTSVKLCKDCRWMKIRKLNFAGEVNECTNPKVNMNRSEYLANEEYASCDSARYTSMLCGQKGKFFEMKDAPVTQSE